MDIVIPLRETPVLLAIGQSLIAALFLISQRRNLSPDNAMLVLVLFVFAALKTDQLYQFIDGPRLAPGFAFWLSPLEWVMTPSLYFYVIALTRTDFRLRLRDAVHLVPAACWSIYLAVEVWPLAPADKLAWMESGVLGTPFHALLLPLVTDSLQCAYVLAAIWRTRAYDLRLADWFSRLEDRELGWVRRILMIWLAMILLHAAMVISRAVLGGGAPVRLVIDALNIAHLTFITLLIYRGLEALFRSIRPEPVELVQQPYVQARLDANERRALYARAVARVTDDALYRQSELTLGNLADLLAATPRELSEAINREGKVSFYAFINGFRVTEIQRLLVEQPQMSMLDIAYEAGFKSKSVYNQTFRAQTGMTPSQYRASRSR